jgi:hypothetical protein
MRALGLQVLLSTFLAFSASGQHLSAVDVKTVELARSRYYNLEAAGFLGMTCAIDFDFTTLPRQSANEEQSRKLLQRTLFTLVLDERGRPTVEHKFPDNSTEAERQDAAWMLKLVVSLFGAPFQTWATKGLQGPIPSFDSSIERVAVTDQGYDFSLNVPGAPVHVSTDKAYLVTRIVSVKGFVTEQPTYKPTAEGLVFAGTKTAVGPPLDVQVQINYDLGIVNIDGFFVPSSVHLKVNQNVDVSFALNECSVKKAQVVKLPPPGKKTD